MAQTTYNKWNSRRWRITTWAILTATILMLYSLFSQYEPTWLTPTLSLLIAIPSVYIAGDSFSKPKTGYTP
ncbi:MAG: hypothetical protein AB7V16_06940 [Vulcanibacillus sp.]